MPLVFVQWGHMGKMKLKRNESISLYSWLNSWSEAWAAVWNLCVYCFLAFCFQLWIQVQPTACMFLSNQIKCNDPNDIFAYFSNVLCFLFFRMKRRKRIEMATIANIHDVSNWLTHAVFKMINRYICFAMTCH